MNRPSIVALSLALAACSACPRGEHQPSLSIAEAVKFANAAAVSEGYELSRYAPPKAHHEFVANDCTWAVFYDAKSESMPGHFSVYVNDHTHRALVAGGM